jgi:hypothetical protein
MEVSSVAPADWISNCAERLKWMGEDAKEMCTALYMNSGSKIKEVLGTPITNKELKLDIELLQSRGLTPHDGVGTKGCNEPQRPDDKSEEDISMDEATKKFLEDNFGALSTSVKSLGDRVKAVEEKQAPVTPPAAAPPPEGPSAEIKALQDSIKSLGEKMEATEKQLSTLKAKKEEEPPEEDEDKKKSKKAKKEEEDEEDKEEDDEPASNEDEKNKKDLAAAEKALKVAEEATKAAKELAAKKEAETLEAQKSIAALSRKVGTPGPQRSRTLLPEDGETPPEGQGKIDPRGYMKLKPNEREAALNAVPVTPEKV